VLLSSRFLLIVDKFELSGFQSRRPARRQLAHRPGATSPLLTADLNNYGGDAELRLLLPRKKLLRGQDPIHR